jgi:hypothetical protein
MEKLLELRVGDGSVHSGLWPLDAADLIYSLLAALAEEGADQELLQTSNPHIQIVKADSTLAALFTNHARQLRPSLTRFTRHAKSLRLGPKGMDFADRATAASCPWRYVDLIGQHTKRKPAKLLRFDPEYRERLDAKRQVDTITGTDEIYAKIIRAGGERPTAKLELLNGDSDTFPVKNQDLAKKLGAHMYEMVKLTADVVWDRVTLKIRTLTVTGIVEAWRDTKLSKLMEQNGGVLPVDFNYDSVEELIENRRSNGPGA